MARLLQRWNCLGFQSKVTKCPHEKISMWKNVPWLGYSRHFLFFFSVPLESYSQHLKLETPKQLSKFSFWNDFRICVTLDELVKQQYLKNQLLMRRILVGQPFDFNNSWLSIFFLHLMKRAQIYFLKHSWPNSLTIFLKNRLYHNWMIKERLKLNVGTLTLTNCNKVGSALFWKSSVIQR